MGSIYRHRNLNRKALLQGREEETVQGKMAGLVVAGRESAEIMERRKNVWETAYDALFGGVGVQNDLLNEGAGRSRGCCTAATTTTTATLLTSSHTGGGGSSTGCVGSRASSNNSGHCFRNDCNNNDNITKNLMKRKENTDCSRVLSEKMDGCGENQNATGTEVEEGKQATYDRLIGIPYGAFNQNGEDDDGDCSEQGHWQQQHHGHESVEGDTGNCTRIGGSERCNRKSGRKNSRMKRQDAAGAVSSNQNPSDTNATTNHERWSMFSMLSPHSSNTTTSSLSSTSSPSSESSTVTSSLSSASSSSSTLSSVSWYSSSSSVSVLVKVLFWFLVFNYHLSVLQACPLVCTCKWKGGKQTVECKNQALETLPDSIDPETQVLDISGNKLGFLPQDAFRRAGLLNLQRIHVRNSRLTQIDPGAFNELKNLVEIDLGDNLLTSVPSLALKATPFLRDLNLAGNPIQRILRGGFEFVPQLVKLDLSRCQLVEIDPQAFAHLKLLESLKISSNRLTSLNNRTVKSLAQLHAMELHDNPWECDCRLRDLKLWIEKENIPHPVSPSCHTPPRLAGKKFSELSVSEFACPPSILEATPTTPRQVRVTEGDNATFECVIESVPSPEVRWYWYNRLIENNTLRKYIIYERESASVLLLLNAMKKDEGVVYCLAENAAGSAEANFTLEILPQPTLQNILDTTQILVIILAIVAVLLVSLAVGIFLFLRQRRNRSAKPPEILATSTPVKPPRLNYEINPGSLVANGFKTKGDSTTDNPDLILETNTNGTYQETAVEDQSSNSELNWEQQSYRNMGYSTEYPPDYGLPIIHENSVYSDSSYYNVTVTPGLNAMNGSATSAAAVMSGVWNKNKVGARITAPSSRDSPDEGYQEGYCGTDV